MVVQNASLPSESGFFHLISSLVVSHDLYLVFGLILLLFTLGASHLLFGLKRALSILPILTIFSCSTYIFYQFMTLFDFSTTFHLVISTGYGLLMSFIFARVSKHDPKFAFGFAPLFTLWLISLWVFTGIDKLGKLYVTSSIAGDQHHQPQDEDYYYDEIDNEELGLLKGIASLFLALFALVLLRTDYRQMFYTACFGTYLLVLSTTMFASLRNCGGIFWLAGGGSGIEDPLDAQFSSECRPPWLLGLEGLVTRVPGERQLSDLHRILFPWSCPGCLLLPTMLALIGWGFQVATRDVSLIDLLKGKARRHSASPLRGRSNASSKPSPRRVLPRIENEEQDQRQWDMEPDVGPAPVDRCYTDTVSVDEYVQMGKMHTIKALKDLLPFLNKQKRLQAEREISRLQHPTLYDSNGYPTNESPRKRLNGRQSIKNLNKHIGMFTCKEATVMLLICVGLTFLVYTFYQPLRTTHIHAITAAGEPAVEGWEHQEFGQPWRGTAAQVHAAQAYLLREPLVGFIQSTLNSARDVRCILGGPTRFDSSAKITDPQVSTIEGQLKIRGGDLHTAVRTISFSHPVNVTSTPEIYSEEQTSYSRCPSSMEFKPAGSSGATWVELPYCDHPTASIIIKEKWKKFVPTISVSSPEGETNNINKRIKRRRYTPMWSVEEIEIKAHLECPWRLVDEWVAVTEHERDWESGTTARLGAGSQQQRLTIELKRPFRVGDYLYELPAVVPEVQLHSRPARV